MPARLSAFLIWAMVAASVVFWGLRLAVHAPEAPGYTLPLGDAVSVGGDLTRLFGTAPVAAAAIAPPPEVASRFRLTGVMAPKRPGADGVALIAIDGKLPRAFRIGAPIDGDLVLQSVSLRTAAIGPPQGKPAVVLELPPLPPAATGALPPPALSAAEQAAPQQAAPQLSAPPAPMPRFVPKISPRPTGVPPMPTPSPTQSPTNAGGANNIAPSAMR
jgi:general secretion pathway protein C